jgi:alginate O-acetyltransferase complex protein AlgI
MLFNSYPFILLFLPATVAGFHLLRRAGAERGAFAALTLASLFFYGWWSPRGLLLLLGLIAVNFGFARALIATAGRAGRTRRAILAAGLAVNLAALGWFKYATFFVDNLNDLLGLDLLLATIVLPLGISFFTFQKIALLVDTYRGRLERLDLLDYALFVTFFPQLVAGPIVHHAEVMPQFRARTTVDARLFATGLAIFAIGLAKKVLLADNAAQFATPVFDAAALGTPVTFLEGWTGALAYTLQLYFDFSGYSDMAIGAGLLFGIRLPLNFASPYKAESIIDFWRRWHMTLSRFLRDYLYVPLGGNRKGPARRHVNLLLTMLLGGIWHGAGWTFLAWGALHGTYLAVNHLWRAAWGGADRGAAARLVARTLTFLAVVVGWVLFRAADLGCAATMLAGMAGRTGVTTGGLIEPAAAWLLLLPLLGIVWLAPNTQELTGYAPDRAQRPPLPGAVWRLSPGWAAATGCLFALALLSLSKVSEFLYFQF